jgi:hypothetical protein
MSEIDLLIYPDGSIKTIYTEEIDLSQFGKPKIQRASMVEPEEYGWYADMALSGGPKLGPFAKRSQALAAEITWLKNNLFGGA